MAHVVSWASPRRNFFNVKFSNAHNIVKYGPIWVQFDGSIHASTTGSGTHAPHLTQCTTIVTMRHFRRKLQNAHIFVEYGPIITLQFGGTMHA